MKFSSVVLILMLVMVVLLAVLIGNTEARSKKSKKGKGGASKVCKYEKKGEEGPCDTATDTKVITMPLRKGDPVTCQANRTVSKPCNDNSLTKKKKMKGCKYERKGSEWKPCDPVSNEKTKVMNLKEGSPPQCPATRTKTKSCGGGNKKPKGARNSRKDV